MDKPEIHHIISISFQLLLVISPQNMKKYIENDEKLMFQLLLVISPQEVLLYDEYNNEC